jgi:hypothetical protein
VSPLSALDGRESIIDCFLPEINPDYAKTKYVRFQESFFSALLGLGPGLYANIRTALTNRPTSTPSRCRSVLLSVIVMDAEGRQGQRGLSVADGRPTTAR